MNQERIYETSIQAPGDKVVGKWHLHLASLTNDNPSTLYHEKVIFLAIVQYDKNLPLYTKLDLAVKHYKPFVEYTFFNVGEKYGKSDSTKVNHSETIIKTITLIQNDKKYNLLEYLNEVASVSLKGHPVTLSQIHYASNDSDDFNNDDDFVSPDSSEFYNDNLDWDQQSPEFWDDIT
ncbi:MAG: hypothetical protein Q8T03_02000 [Bacteroidota bacterium]|nr:hypothetical protein [Bacteroidota bacterium]